MYRHVQMVFYQAAQFLHQRIPDINTSLEIYRLEPRITAISVTFGVAENDVREHIQYVHSFIFRSAVFTHPPISTDVPISLGAAADVYSL